MRKTLLISLLFLITSCSHSMRIPEYNEKMVEQGSNPEAVEAAMKFATNIKNLRLCEDVIDMNRLYNAAKECNDSFHPFNGKIDPPSCFLITADDPAVETSKDMSSNHINVIGLVYSEEFGIMVEISKFVGAYMPGSGTMVLVENSAGEIERIYSHEVHHHLLKMKGLPDSNAHDDPVFNDTCSTKTYEPATDAASYGWWRRLASLF